MLKQTIAAFLEAIGAENIVYGDTEWVRCSCPLAPAHHVSRKDSRPSFGIKEDLENESWYHCFTCGSGSVFSLASKLSWMQALPTEALSILLLSENANSEGLRNRTGCFYDPFKNKMNAFVNDPPSPVPQEVLDRYPKIADRRFFEPRRCLEWFEARGISEDTVVLFSTRFDAANNGIVFPLMDTDGLTYKLQFRSRIEKVFYYINASLLNYDKKWGRKDSWFGMQFYNPNLPVVLVESETDVLRLYSLGVRNVLASCGSVSKHQMSRILSHHILLGFDVDDAGKAFTEKALRLVPKGHKVSLLNWRFVGAKDAGDHEFLKTREDLDHVFNNRKVLFNLKGGGSNGLIPKRVYYKDAFTPQAMQ